eukprot:Plantae.Rhodophyta-Purpureofilum_apyrenoidigerum.ctg24448.p1 GENE.Plantae.Rhodophyta-Purpureofilum_apyrenoidigerum.ctg24448~~Plantae.Rhodophyta-Purpureofilum_apyrenoidigerum.ctg24448.p1  ORF type:complete len:492 (+),score=98.12 Plantae.Rhodophyta-Purpureofilum_apyrenoidigerum.ctg24448:153-1628(+)
MGFFSRRKQTASEDEKSTVVATSGSFADRSRMGYKRANQNVPPNHSKDKKASVPRTISDFEVSSKSFSSSSSRIDSVSKSTHLIGSVEAGSSNDSEESRRKVRSIAGRSPSEPASMKMSTASAKKPPMSDAKRPPAKEVRRRPAPLLESVEESTASPGRTFQGMGFHISAVGIIKSPKVERKISEALLKENGKTIKMEKRIQITVRSLKDIKVIRTLGIGASGRVSLARHTKSGKYLAVKVVNVYDDEKRMQLLHELETLMKFISRFWVRFYGAFYDGSGAVYIALEYMDCGSLLDVMGRCGAIPEQLMKAISQHCAHALKTLHETRWVHRDFKSANILLSSEQQKAKLSDFGLARQLTEGMESIDEFVGTLAYLSPERLNGKPYTYAADIWAFGLTIAECLLGSHPFGESSVYFDYLDKAMDEKDILPDDGRFSEDARDFVRLCMNCEPENRPSAKELLDHPWLTSNLCKDSDFEEWLTTVAKPQPQPQA